MLARYAGPMGLLVSRPCWPLGLGAAHRCASLLWDLSVLVRIGKDPPDRLFPCTLATLPICICTSALHPNHSTKLPSHSFLHGIKRLGTYPTSFPLQLARCRRTSSAPATFVAAAMGWTPSSSPKTGPQTEEEHKATRAKAVPRGRPRARR